MQQGSSNSFTSWPKHDSRITDRLIDELGIDILFTDCSKIGIRVCWGRYLEISASSIMHAAFMRLETGPLIFPASSEVLIIEVFISNRLV